MEEKGRAQGISFPTSSLYFFCFSCFKDTAGQPQFPSRYLLEKRASSKSIDKPLLLFLRAVAGASK